MAQSGKGDTSASDIEAQITTIRQDISKLTEMMKDLGREKVSEARSTAQAEAAELLGRTRKAADDAADKARAKVASIEDYIVEKPVQSTIMALLIGMVLGAMSRR